MGRKFYLLIGFLLATIATPHLATAAQCPPPNDSGNQCSANDLTAAVTGIIGPSACTDGELYSVTLELVLGNSAATRDAGERYDVGIFGAQFGDPVFGGDSCSFRALAPVEPPLDLDSGLGPFRDLDGDACGDNERDRPTTVLFLMEDVLCQDTDGDGNADIDFSLSWRNNKNDQCDDPTDESYFVPEQASRCLLEVGFDIPVIVEPPLSVEMIKIATPSLVSEPEAMVTFRMGLINTSSATDPLQIISLVDDVYGDLNGQGSCEVPVTIAPGAIYFCEFEQLVQGSAGDELTDVITATLNDNEGNTLVASASAKVVFESPAPPVPSIHVIYGADPDNVDEPGGDVNYIVSIQNTSAASIVIDTLTDSTVGDLNGRGSCTLPQVLPPVTGTYICQHIEVITGQPGDSFTSTVNASGSGEGQAVSGSGDVTVVINNVPSAIAVRKEASPDVVDEPGGDVTISVVIQNQSLTDTVTIGSMLDSVQGDLNGVGDCSLPVQIQPAGVHQCFFTETVTGNAGDEFTDTVFVTGFDDDGHVVSGADSTFVRIHNLVSSIGVEKIADPPEIQAPGGPVSFRLKLTNTSQADDITIETLSDDIYGDLNGQGNCSVPQSLQPGGVYHCSFDETISGSNGDVFTDVVTASGTDDDGDAVSASDSADVVILPGEVGLSITKNAIPAAITEPGGDVTFEISVYNTGDIDLALTSLIDDVYGDLNGQGDCIVPQVARSGAEKIYACSFTGNVNGNAGEIHENTVTVTGDAGVDGSATASDSASVEILDSPSSMVVSKSANPAVIKAPGGDISFQVAITNTSIADSIIVDSLLDSVFGNLNGQGDCSVPREIVPGDKYTCEFIGNVAGSNGDTHENTVTVSATDDDGNVMTGDDNATVNITQGELSLTVTKVASQESIPEPGGSVSYEMTVRNTGNIAMDITAITDDIYGPLDGQGSCSLASAGTLQPGDSYACSFPGDVAGNAGVVVTDTITVSGDAGVDGSTSGMDTASVTITDLPSSINVRKIAIPKTHEAPGGKVAYLVEVTNTSQVDTVTINSLVDDQFGDLNGVGTCTVPHDLAPSGFYACLFSREVQGDAGDSHSNIVTISGVDDDGAAVSGNDEATVDFIEAQLSMNVSQTPSPASVQEPGGDIEFTVSLENHSELELVVTSLQDDLYGDLNGQGNCSTPQTLAAMGGTWSCTHTQDISGVPGDSFTNTLVAEANAGVNGTTSGSDNATVTITDVTSAIAVLNLSDPNSVVEPGGPVKFFVSVTNTSSVDTVLLESLVDSVYGDLNGSGTCALPQTLPPALKYDCDYEEQVTGQAGDEQSNTVVAKGTDDDGIPVEESDTTSVKITEAETSISVFKSANPSKVPGPGYPANFTVNVVNSSVDQPLSLLALDDDQFGDLDGKGTCELPQLITVGAGYGCTFTGIVNGPPNSAHINIVTAVVTPDQGAAKGTIKDLFRTNIRQVSGQASAIVLILGSIAPIESIPIPVLSSGALLLLVLLFGWIGLGRLRRRKTA